jgi:hypothetical protein
MKTRILITLTAILALADWGRASVQLIQFGEAGIAAVVPDNNLSGLARNYVVTGQDNFIAQSLTISLKLQGTGFGAFNGDYYADLRHVSANGTTTRLVTLLNRAGRTTSMTSGYSDNGFDVTFDDTAAADIHNYRITLNGAASTPLSGALTGTWQPDGRDVDLLTVLDTSSRTSTLGGLATGSPNGTWTLFIADAKAGGTGQLTDWQVTISGVPEPSSASLLILGLAAVLARRRRCRI